MANSILTEDQDAGRRIAFLLAQAEAALGLRAVGLPLHARLLAVLHGAMEQPSKVDPSAYSVAYRLMEGNQC